VEKLEELRCRYAQGYLVATPMTGAELEAWAISSKACGVA
jgi:EAL domain-containing protein (putative c-di-GMP-specific phosphodiesterase class I)